MWMENGDIDKNEWFSFNPEYVIMMGLGRVIKMSAIALTGRRKNAVTMVSNLFIDSYMATANGEYVKVYLYLLRHLGSENQEITISSLADVFEHTEKDIFRALVYWEKAGLLSLTYSEGGEILAVEILDVMNKKAGHKEYPQPAPKTSKKLAELQKNEEFSRLMYIAQQYMGTTIKPTDCDIFANLYTGLHFSVELLEFLIELSVSNGHISVRYMESVALDWHQRGITTVEEAREYASSYNKESLIVMKAFGLSNRRPVTIEKNMIDKWFHTYGFCAGVITEACSRTIAKIHQPSFEYADKILSTWKEQGVKTKEDIEALDIKFKNLEKQTKSKPQKGTSPKQGNKFHNFPQRNYDYDELLKQIRQ